MTKDSDLLNFVSSVSGEAYLKVEESLGDGYVRLRISEAERRQAKHDIRCVEDIVVELLRNSRDAHAHRMFLASSRDGDLRTLTLIDDGIGVPTHMQEKIFEPRVTSKLETMVIDQWGVHGRGMALFSIRSNAVEARIVSSDPDKGAALSVITETSTLTERADQSSWPTTERDDEGAWRVSRGPHNVVRQVVEFAIEHAGVELYLGSPTEILVTMSALARAERAASELGSCADLSRLPVWQRPAAAADAEEFVEIATALGLPISERTAHRIRGGELAALRSVFALATRSGEPAAEPSQPDIYRDRRGLKIHHTDLAEFRRELESAFDTIAERYYLHLKCEPKITVGREDIRVRFEVEKED